MKNYTDRELLDLIDSSLKQTSKDVREGRVPLDGRARLLPDEPAEAGQKPAVPNAAE